jgi:hypothetical protein
MPKYKQVVNQMLEKNKELFDSFRIVHDKYALNPDKWQIQLNLEGERVMEVIQEYENLLCSSTEGGGYGKFSANLADKFRQEVKRIFPKVYCIGIE